ncbi:MAG TPA: dTDP-4-dehydrorhamnose 3,5-epimerase family protein [Thermoanaerobaculia bacterium]|jgi:dTDP-4-dehydrorhamnose 3,5-epimerase|nr:dTDP-4-dehydrorhamnose 3,5-epimerase family protein [Thermoanaerobaculia bacterium]
MLSGARKDPQLVTKEWEKIEKQIDGVVVREVRHVPRDHGVITEIFRPEWDPTGLPIVHIYQSRLFPGAIGAWSCHGTTIDRLFVNQGHLKVVLFDGREGSPSYRRVVELHVGDARPAFVILPAGVWHGLQNLGSSDALVINCPTKAYNYEDPDHYRLPFDSPEIPYSWTTSAATRLRSDAR